MKPFYLRKKVRQRRLISFLISGISPSELVGLVEPVLQKLENPTIIPSHVRHVRDTPGISFELMMQLFFVVISAYTIDVDDPEELARANHDISYRLFFQRYHVSIRFLAYSTDTYRCYF